MSVREKTMPVYLRDLWTPPEYSTIDTSRAVLELGNAHMGSPWCGRGEEPWSVLHWCGRQPLRDGLDNGHDGRGPERRQQ